jgi:hypothetical protein
MIIQLYTFSGVGRNGRLLIVLALFQMMALNLDGQDNGYDPDKLFRGVQFSFDFRMTGFLPMKFEHDEGYFHEVYTKGSMGYEFGFQGQYYFSKNWSLQLGIMVGSRRNLNYDVYLQEPKYFRELTDDVELLDQLYKIGLQNFNWSRDRLSANWSLPVSVGYHQYLSRNSRHRLDYRLGLAARYYRPLNYRSKGDVVQDGNRLYFFERLYLLYHFDPKVVVDLQPSFNYTYVLKNKKAISFGVLANLAFAKNRSENYFKILEKTAYEEIGHFKISSHYLALQFGYIFTTPEKPKRRTNKKSQEMN